jgi:hypothetical protein
MAEAKKKAAKAAPKKKAAAKKPAAKKSTADAKAPAKAPVIKDKQVVRVGTLNLDASCHVDVKKGIIQNGKVNEAGKIARKAVKEYFMKQFGLDVVTKFTPTANISDDAAAQPGFMIMARANGNKSSLFSTAIKINHKRGNFITVSSDAAGKLSSLKISDINAEVAGALREYRDLYAGK